MAQEGKSNNLSPPRKQQVKKPCPDNNSIKHKKINDNQKVAPMEVEVGDSNQLIGSLSTQASNNINSINFINESKKILNNINHIFYPDIQNENNNPENQNQNKNVIQENKNENISKKSQNESNKAVHSYEPNNSNNSNIIIEENESNVSNGAQISNMSQSMKIEEKEIFKFDFIKDEELVKYSGEYLNEIYTNLLYDEMKLIYRPKFGYMDIQKDINHQMRAILVDWLVEVHFRFKLKNETLFQTVRIIDTYLSMSPIIRARLQLLGIAALLISCKSQEIYYPQLNEFIDITDGAYVKSDLVEMEAHILKVLNFNIMSPTSNDFYNIIAKAFNFDQKQYFFGRYFLESSLVDYQMIKYSSSVIAVSCAYIVMKYFSINNYKNLYSKDVIKENCPEKVIKIATKEICFLVRNLNNSPLRAVKEKFSLPQFLNVAQLLEQQ